MNIFNKKRIFTRIRQIVVLLPFFLISCTETNEVESLFQNTVSERTEASLDSLRSLLRSSEHGWRLDYQPDKENVGIFKFLFKFTSDSAVEIASDFSVDDAMMQSSEYSILQGTTTKLSFSTFSALHKLSDANNSPIPGAGGSGLRGDFEFLYYGQEEESGNLIFRTNRTRDTIMFVRATPETLSEIEASARGLVALSSRISSYLFPALTYTDDDGEEVSAAQIFYSNATRLFSISTMVGIGSGTEYETPIICVNNADGSLIVDSLRMGETTFHDVSFSFNLGSNSYVGQVGNFTVKIEGRSIPIVSDHLEFIALSTGHVRARLRYFHRDTDSNSLALNEINRNSGFDALYQDVIDNNTVGEISTTLTLWFNFAYEGNPIDYLFLFRVTSTTRFPSLRNLIGFMEGPERDRLILTDEGFRDSASGIGTTPAYDRMIATLTDSEGFYVQNLGRFTAYPNDIYLIISVRDPSIRIGFYK